MKQIKKVISIIVSMMLLFSSAGVTASDYDEHWAKESIDALRLKNIISGDGNGNINPDVSITRAEFVKVVNRAFAFNIKASDSYPDVAASSWYADEFKIAKHQGYISGDQFGNANPEKNITRAEVAVILCRVLNLKGQGESIDFSDTVPEWAKEYIGAMTAKGYLSGYPDKSFRAENPIQRGEAFSVIHRIISNSKNNNEEMGNVSSTPTKVTNSSGSSGGGGGGGSSSSSSSAQSLASPMIPKYDKDNNIIYFTKVNGASGYVLKLSSFEQTKEYNIDYSSEGSSTYKSEIKKYIDDFCKNADYPTFDTEIYLKAVDGKKQSSYSKVNSFAVELPALSKPNVSWKYETIGENTNLVIEWDEVKYASSYKVLFVVNGAENNSYILNEQERFLVVPNYQNLKDKTVELSIRAISGNENLKSSEKSSLNIKEASISGSGTVDSPYIVRTSDDFEMIRENPNAHFIIANDINLGNFEPIPSFGGTLKTSSENIMATITATIDVKGNNVGLFGEIKGEGTVKNIIMKGSVKGTQNIGGISGKLSGNAVVKNCINYAEISGNMNVGGISGYTDAGNILVSHCYNFGKITSASANVGGIGGYYNKAKVEKCGNYGEVSGDRNVGGILGAAYCSIYDSFNLGNVNAAGVVGGISGTLQKGWIIHSCYNLGAVTSSATAVTGGINGTITNLASEQNNAKIEFCYNVGVITGSKTFQIVPKSDTLNCSSCYYVSNSASEGEGIKVTSSELSDENNMFTKQLLELGKFEMNDNDDNIYPSIKDNPQNYPTNISQCLLQNIKSERNKSSIKFTWEFSKKQNDTMSYKIIDKENYDIIKTGTFSTDITEYVFDEAKDNKYYSFVVHGKVNGTLYIAGELLVSTYLPKKINNLHATVTGQTINITFDKPVGADLSKIFVYLDDILVEELDIDKNTAKIDGLKGEKEYTVTVRLSDKFNNISDPVSVTVKTEPKDYYAEWLNNTILESPGVTFVEIN